MNFSETVATVPDEVLLKIGERIAANDYCVTNFSNGSPGFKGNRELLLTTVRKAYAIGANNHRSVAMEILVDYLDKEK